MRLTLAIQKSKADNSEKPAAASGGSALNDLVDLNFGGGAPAQGPSPPQRTAASLDPWSPAGQAGDNGAGGDPWGGIGAHGVPPSRASPLAFHQGSPPQALHNE